MAASFFRKSALEKLSTPEKLDQLIKITTPKAWLALATIGLILFTSIGWGFAGRVKTKVNATGVLFGGEVYDVVSTAQGQLIDLRVQIGDQIAEGDVIAEIEQPVLFQQIEEAKASLAERNFELKQLLQFGSQDTRLQGELIDQERISIQQQIESNQKNLAFYSQQLEIEKDLLEKGLITRAQLVNTEQQIERAENQIETLKAQLVQTSSRELNVGFDMTKRTTLIKQRIAQEERRIAQLKERYEIQSRIRSPHSGQVVEVLTDAGVVVRPGSPLFKLKNQFADNDTIRGILYVPSQDGKKIKVGMEALVVPATVQPQEFGYMRARVTYVSEFPVTQQGMMTSMKNDQLVRGLLALGAPFEVYVDFIRDSTSYSGFQWTSAKGPEVSINAGTSCSGKITVHEEAPVTMVVPAVKKFFELY
ncbi:MAG: NHLP bacteriocin system secretion protein [Bacteroidota bacterium]